jgi:hypothetical protein
MNTVSLNLVLPGEVYNNLIAFVNTVIKTDSNDFIVQAINQKLQAEKELLQQNLIQGYKASNQEDLELTKEFELIDFEKIY